MRPSDMRPTGLLALGLIVLAGCGPASAPPAAAPSPAPAEPHIVCTEDGATRVNAETLEARPEGVNVIVDNRAGEPASINGFGVDVPEGLRTVVVRAAPGPHEVACWPLSRHSGKEPPRHPLTVEDPHGYWADPSLECTGDLAMSAIYDHFGLGPGVPGDPVDLARGRLEGLRDDDEVRPAGYPEAQYRTVAVVRAGRTIATMAFSPAEEPGRWRVDGFDACDGEGVRDRA